MEELAFPEVLHGWYLFFRIWHRNRAHALYLGCLSHLVGIATGEEITNKWQPRCWPEQNTFFLLFFIRATPPFGFRNTQHIFKRLLFPFCFPSILDLIGWIEIDPQLTGCYQKNFPNHLYNLPHKDSKSLHQNPQYYHELLCQRLKLESKPNSLQQFAISQVQIVFPTQEFERIIDTILDSNNRRRLASLKNRPPMTWILYWSMLNSVSPHFFELSTVLDFLVIIIIEYKMTTGLINKCPMEIKE